MHRWTGRASLAALGISAALAAAPGAGARAHAAPLAQAAGSCHIASSGHGYGYSYLTWLWVYRTNCATGTHVAKRHGHVRGWSCHRRVLDRSPVQYDAKVTCKSGRREVAWTYTQNT